MSAVEIVTKVWNYAHDLRDDGVGYGDYVEQITYLIFLKIADEREKASEPSLQFPHPGPLPEEKEPSPQSSPSGRGGNGVPREYAWAELVRLDGDDLENQNRIVAPDATSQPYMKRIEKVSGVSLAVFSTTNSQDKPAKTTNNIRLISANADEVNITQLFNE